MMHMVVMVMMMMMVMVDRGGDEHDFDHDAGGDCDRDGVMV